MANRITIRMGAAHDDVTFHGYGKGQSGIVFDRAEARKQTDPSKRGVLLRGITAEIIDETEVLKDRDKRRHRRMMDAKFKSRKDETVDTKDKRQAA